MNFKATQRTNVEEFRQGLNLVCLFAACIMIACFFTISSSAGQSISTPAPRSVISLASSPKPPAEIVARRAGDARFEKATANYHVFPAAAAGESTSVEELTLNFAGETTLTRIKSTNKDFVIERGGTCQEGDTYPLRRKLFASGALHAAGPGPPAGLCECHAHGRGYSRRSSVCWGTATSPVSAFRLHKSRPCRAHSPPGPVCSGGALSLAVDGGDTLYIADTGNNAVRYVDSSGVICSFERVWHRHACWNNDGYRRAMCISPSAPPPTLFKCSGLEVLRRYMMPDPILAHTERPAPSAANPSLLPEGWQRTRVEMYS